MLLKPLGHLSFTRRSTFARRARCEGGFFLPPRKTSFFGGFFLPPPERQVSSAGFPFTPPEGQAASAGWLFPPEGQAASAGLSFSKPPNPKPGQSSQLGRKGKNSNHILQA
ncbi:MAG: hypothetical protein ACKVT2_08460 [Saprospiraceae bacterium]